MTKRSVGFAIGLFCVAGVFVLYALITFGLAKGDLFAIVEHSIPKRRGRGTATEVSYPAYVTINAALGYATAMSVTAIAHLRTQKSWHLAGMLIAFVAAAWAAIDGFALGVDSMSKTIALVGAGIAVMFGIVGYVKTIQESKMRAEPNAIPPQSTWT